jgi:hypothetical protein
MLQHLVSKRVHKGGSDWLITVSTDAGDPIKMPHSSDFETCSFHNLGFLSFFLKPVENGM